MQVNHSRAASAGLVAAFAAGLPAGRAQSVRDAYLQDSRGEVRKHAQLVACLAPNRRVVIEVPGTTP